MGIKSMNLEDEVDQNYQSITRGGLKTISFIDFSKNIED